ncbi:DUF3147 family protein [candidate division KSB1 bacterium]|nr:DUF3147 family protein [candidate division KSB1 bacterium]
MNLFFWHVFLSFLIAGIWIGGATLVAERLGSKIGGLAANLPSNIVVSFAFLAITQNAEFTARAAQAVPLGMLIDTVFILIFVVLVPRGMATALAGSLLTWFVLVQIAGHSGIPGWPVVVFTYFLGMILIFFFMHRVLRIHTAPSRRKPFSLIQLVLRMIFSGSVVAFTVVAARLFGAQWAGLVSTFPAVLLSTLVILTQSQGKDFARSTGKVLAVSSSNIIIYAATAAWTFPRLGWIAGTAIAYFAALVWVAALRPYVMRLQ